VTTLPDELKSISYKDTAKVLKALGRWAETERVAVVAPWHLNKKTGGDTAIRIMDSRAFRTAVRSMLLVVADPDAAEGSTVGIVALDKANAGTLNIPGLRFVINSASYVVEELDEQTGEVREVITSCGVATWAGVVEGDARQVARDALAPRIDRAGGPREWLRTYLIGAGEASRQDVLDSAREDGFSPDSIKRAARSIRVHSRDESGRDERTGRPWRRAIWSLPERTDSSRCTSLDTEPTAPTAPTEEMGSAPTDLITAGQVKSVQSVQSDVSRPTGSEVHLLGESLLEPPRCIVCRQPLALFLVARGETTHPTCDPAGLVAQRRPGS
jgi:hypothetical protein